MERTATHDSEYVDIVLGYQHILAFSLVFGALIFGTGYFVGYYRARTEPPQRVSETVTSQPDAAATPTASTLPAVIPSRAPVGDVLKDMESASKTGLGLSGETDPASAAPLAATPEAPPAAEPTPVDKAAVVTPEPETAEPAPLKKQSAPPAESKKKPAPQAKVSKPTAAPTRSSAKPLNARGGNIYLQMSSFGEARDAQHLIDNLASDGVRALVDQQLVGGKHTVLVGPFSDFKTAMGKAKELKDQNFEAFPIRR